MFPNDLRQPLCKGHLAPKGVATQRLRITTVSRQTELDITWDDALDSLYSQGIFFKATIIGIKMQNCLENDWREKERVALF